MAFDFSDVLYDCCNDLARLYARELRTCLRRAVRLGKLENAGNPSCFQEPAMSACTKLRVSAYRHHKPSRSRPYASKVDRRVTDFGPSALKSIRQAMIEVDLCSSHDQLPHQLHSVCIQTGRRE